MRRVADDGVGLAVAERVSGLGLSKVDVAKYCEDACALMEAWEGYGNVILVDATQSGAMPGTVRSFDSRAMPPTKRAFGISTHGFGCMDACAVGSPSHRRETAGPAKRCKCSTTGGDHHRTPRHRYGSRSSPRAIVNLRPCMRSTRRARRSWPSPAIGRPAGRPSAKAMVLPHRVVLIAVAWRGLSRFARLWTPYIALGRFADPAVPGGGCGRR